VQYALDVKDVGQKQGENRRGKIKENEKHLH
jgi:hypothetical protein